MSAEDASSSEKSNFVAEVVARSKAQAASRERLAMAKPLDEAELRGLDSKLPKTTAFMKRIKNIATGQQAALIADLSKLNLSKFVEEMAQAIAEAKLKTNDIPAVIDVCVEVAARYEKFGSQLLAELKKGLPAKKSDKVSNPGKLRVDLRLTADLLLHGVLPAREGLAALGNGIVFLVHTDSKVSFVKCPLSSQEFAHMAILLPALRACGRDIGNFVPLSAKKQLEGGELPSPSEVIRDEQRKTFMDLLTNYHSSLVQQAQTLHDDMTRLIRKIKRFERSRGDAPQEDKLELEAARGKFEKINSQGLELSEVLGLEFPDLPAEPSDDEEDDAAAVQMAADVSEGRLSLWADEETRRFYEVGPSKELQDGLGDHGRSSNGAGGSLQGEQFRRSRRWSR